MLPVAGKGAACPVQGALARGRELGMVGVSAHSKLHNKVGVDHCFPPDRVPGFPGMYGWLAGFST